MTYRAGTHHGVTINRDGDGFICGRPGHDCPRGHIVAVVTNGDWDLAEHICDRLNADTPDVDHTNGAREALAHVRRQLDAWSKFAGSDERLSAYTVSGMLRIAAAELGVDEQPPASPAKPWECKLVREHNPATEPCDCRISQFCAMGRSLDDAPGSPLSAPVAAERPPAGGSECTKAPEGSQRLRLNERYDVVRRIAERAEHRPSSLGGDGLGYGPCVGCAKLWPCPDSRDERKADQA